MPRNGMIARLQKARLEKDSPQPSTPLADTAIPNKIIAYDNNISGSYQDRNRIISETLPEQIISSPIHIPNETIRNHDNSFFVDSINPTLPESKDSQLDVNKSIPQKGAGSYQNRNRIISETLPEQIISSPIQNNQKITLFTDNSHKQDSNISESIYRTLNIAPLAKDSLLDVNESIPNKGVEPHQDHIKTISGSYHYKKSRKKEHHWSTIH
jgi:hypothetical protein